MSHLGSRILYGLYNADERVWCERVFAPWPDMEALLLAEKKPLFALESGDPVRDFDMVAFTLQYELSYSNVLHMLSLSGIPLLSAERTGLSPFVIAGGPCACNPEPLADFIDAFVIGEGEETALELNELYLKAKEENQSRKEMLWNAAQIEGVYVPAFYEPSYNDDGTIADFKAKKEYAGVPEKIKKRIVRDLNKVYYPENTIVPYIEIVHDRAVQEIFRGCIRGCRFCQAGYIYRPQREKSPEVIISQAKVLCDHTGYDELSLNSLSTADYADIDPLLSALTDMSKRDKISISVPSLRIDAFSEELTAALSELRRSGLTFAPEAGTQRLRDSINKRITRDEILSGCRKAFLNGWNAVKLYFMLGLPGETDEDVTGIAVLAKEVVDVFYEDRSRVKGKSLRVTLSTAGFVPKAFTPFQWAAQCPMQELERKQKLLKESLIKRVTYNYHDAKTGFLEAVFARGDRRLGKVLLLAHEKGARFDGWHEYFSLERWLEAFKECGVDPEFYTSRERSYEEKLPWDHIDIGVDKSFLISEAEKAKETLTTINCREGCSGCGAGRWHCGVCLR
jgi:radical SAM family uncharacterized protein